MNWITHHWQTLVAIGTVLGTYHIGSAIVGSLDMPDANSSKLYRFLFKFLNQLAANYSRAKASSGPIGHENPQPGNGKAVDSGTPKA
jgi:hypothetical protein